MISAQELKDALLLSLAEQLGTYSFSNGITVAAIRIDDGASPYPEEPQVDGLEIVIVPQIEVSVQVLMGGYQDTHSTLIALKQWTIDKTTTPSRGPLLATLSQFPSLNIRSLRRIIRSSKLDNVETLSVLVEEIEYIPGENF